MSGELGDPERAEPGELVAGRYQLTRRIARGGMGEVFASLDRSTGRAVALKRLRPSALAQRGMLANFRREYHALAELRHPRIIEVYDYGLDRDKPYYTMELLDGQDLRDLSPLPYREACLYLRDVASSLALLHARRLLHRDVSPRNVRRTSDGHCKLLDFGAMVPFGVPPNVTGTPPCVPPEALQGASLDQRADLYSLGALAYCLLTGRNGHDVSTLEALPDAWARPIKRPSQRVPDLPAALDELVMSLLSVDPMKRPKSAAEVIDWLSAAVQLPADDAPGAARSFLTSSQLCGRTAQTEELTSRLQRTAAGRGGAIAIEGALGAGKSRILDEAALIAQTCGLCAVRAVARPARGFGHELASDLVTALQQIAPLEAEHAGIAQVDWGAGPANDVSADPIESRLQLQRRLTDLFCTVARSRPLLLAVDDVHHADSFSVALLASLTHRASELPLTIVIAYEAGSAQDRLRALFELAFRMQLAELSEADCAQLVASMFGAVQHIDRLSNWLFRAARGNPKLIVELCEHLMQRGLLRYSGGTWELPTDEIDEVLPQDLTHAWSLRLSGLPEAARALGELLSVRRGGASAELCLAVSALPADETLSALDALVRAGVLESARDDYVFAHAALRRAVHAAIPSERREALHKRWAEQLLSQPDATPDVQLEAGWHLVHTADALRGAQLLAAVAPQMTSEGRSLERAIPAAEKALEVYEQHGMPLADRLSLRATLVLAGYLFDYRLALRYGDETMVMLARASGIALAKRLQRWLGVGLGLYAALAWTSLRRLWLPKNERGPNVYTAIQHFARAGLGLLGVHAVALDGPGCMVLAETLEPLKALPGFTPGRLVYYASQTFALQASGRVPESGRALEVALATLRANAYRDLTEHERKSLLIGLLTVQGALRAQQESARGLAVADALEQIGTGLAKASAERVRMICHLRRGDIDAAERCRRLIDLFGVQGGTTWQVEWFALPLEAMAGAIWMDLVLLRRSRDRLQRVAREVPWLAPHAESVAISYHFRRGDYARAIELGEHYAAEYPPLTVAGWSWTFGVIGLSLVGAGQAERAKELCGEVLRRAGHEDFDYPWMFAPLEAAYATALAVLGDRAQADAIIEARLAVVRERGEAVDVVCMYQHIARIARLLDDRPALLDAVHAMREEALASGLPAVILVADREAELQRETAASPLPPTAAAREAVSAGATVRKREQTATSTFLLGCDGPERHRHALRLLARWLASEQAYLYVRATSGLQLLAALMPETEDARLVAALESALQTPRERAFERLDLPGYTRHGVEQPAARYRLIFLRSPDAAPSRANDWVGIVLAREGESTPEGIPEALIADVAQLLANDQRSAQVTRVR